MRRGSKSLGRFGRAVVPERDSDVAKTGITDGKGLFSGQLSPGRYTLHVESAGFIKYDRRVIRLSFDRQAPAKIDVTLHVGSMSEVVEVAHQIYPAMPERNSHLAH